MSDHTAPEIWDKPAAAVELPAIDFTSTLDAAETLNGAPTITVDGGSGPTIDQVAVNAAPVECAGRTVAIGKALLCRIQAGGVDGTTYRLTITAPTSAGRTLVKFVHLKIVNH